MNHAGHHPHLHGACCHGGATSETVVKDPVCGMSVDPETTPHHASHAGEEYHFCSARCREKFVASPDSHLAAFQRRSPPKARSGSYSS